MAVRVVHWGTGPTGIEALRGILDHPELELVGLYVARPERAGRDAGSFVGKPDTGIVATKLFETSQLLSTVTSEPVQANKAIVGRNAFAHEAGIHQDGVLKDVRTYEIMRPEDVGQSAASRLVLGRHSGRHAVQQRSEALGFTLTSADLDLVYRAVIALGENRKVIGDGDLRRIVERVQSPQASAALPSTAPHVEAVGYGHGV